MLSIVCPGPRAGVRRTDLLISPPLNRNVGIIIEGCVLGIGFGCSNWAVKGLIVVFIFSCMCMGKYV